MQNVYINVIKINFLNSQYSLEIVSLTSKFGYNLQTVSVVSVLKKSPETHLVSKFMKSDNFYVHLAYMSTQQVTTQTLCRENKSLCSLESAKLKIKGNLLSFIWFLPYRFYRPFGHVVALQNINENLSFANRAKSPQNRPNVLILYQTSHYVQKSNVTQKIPLVEKYYRNMTR